MLVREVMTAPVVSVGADTSVKEAVELLARHGITAMPVLDGAELVGMLSEADVLGEAFLPDPRAHEKPVQISGGPAMTRVGEVMSRHVLTVPPGADLAEAAGLMLDTVVKSLPVVEGNHVVGILSRRDLVAVLARRDDDIEAGLDELFRTAGYDWTVAVTDGVVTVAGPEQDSEVEMAKVLAGTVPGVVGLYFPAQRGGPGRR